MFTFYDMATQRRSGLGGSTVGSQLLSPDAFSAPRQVAPGSSIDPSLVAPPARNKSPATTATTTSTSAGVGGADEIPSWATEPVDVAGAAPLSSWSASADAGAGGASDGDTFGDAGGTDNLEQGLPSFFKSAPDPADVAGLGGLTSSLSGLGTALLVFVFKNCGV
jgi:hypothetical protein